MNPTPWQAFAQRWSSGCGSDQCSQAHRIVLARGCVPADILLIGEAPGESEDSIGQPFVGPAGHLLDYITSHSIPQQIPEWRTPPPHTLPQRKVRVAYTNLVGCIPREGGKKAGYPEDEQIVMCSPRLAEFTVLCDPALVICVGTLARTFLDRKHLRSAKMYWRHIEGELGRTIAICDILHPAFLLRQNEAVRSLMRRRCIITISEACQDVFEDKSVDTTPLPDEARDEEIPF